MVSKKAERLLEEAKAMNDLILAADQQGTLVIDEKGIRGMIVIEDKAL